MNGFYVAHHTDIGIKKKTNQDSLLVKGLTDGNEELLLAVLCDGMGGMAKGELASAIVVRAMSDWIAGAYIGKGDGPTPKEIQEQWRKLFFSVNKKLVCYGEENGVRLGTTATAILLFNNGAYLIGHIGDTRIYRITEQGLMEQLTEDHTFVAREIRRGNMTPEQAATDSRRNVLLQCIGVDSELNPQFAEGRLAEGDGVLLCSDGFRHELSREELGEALRPDRFFGEDGIRRKLAELTELNKRRKETDNISAVYVKMRKR